MNKSRKQILSYLLIFLISGFILLTVLISVLPVTLLDREFSEELQEHPYPILDNLMKGISWFGNMPVSVLIVVIVAVIFFGILNLADVSFKSNSRVFKNYNRYMFFISDFYGSSFKNLFGCTLVY